MADDNSLVLDAARAVVDHVCSNPYRLPDGQMVRCRSRLKKVCPGCADLAVKDWAAIMRSGIFDTPASARFMVVTLTAPSFGATHWVVKDGRAPRRCRCGVMHRPDLDAELRGIPLDVDDYDYAGTLRWNLAVPLLFRNFVRSVRERCPSTAYVVVREWQARGTLHLHVIFRIDAGDCPSEAEIVDVARSVTARDDHGPTHRFGTEVTAEFVRADGNVAKLVWYLCKAVSYLVKDVDETSTAAGRLATEHFRRLTVAAWRSMRCPRCPDDGAPCHARCHRQWGARSHVVTQSRGERAWSLTGLTRKRQREQRAEWVARASGIHGDVPTGEGWRRFRIAVEARRLLDGSPFAGIVATTLGPPPGPSSPTLF
ncbi:MAG: hypothetical protein FWF28_04920 [Micrococcales bacterium]|nr:hypothetical protein [Micrococcales bacterium]